MTRSLKTLTMLAALLTLPLIAPAALVPHGTIADYEAPGTFFTADGLTFSDFSILSSTQGGATAVIASGVSLYTDVLPSGRVILKFSAGWDAGMGETSDSHIRFKVTAAQGTSMVGNLLNLTAFGQDTTGVVSITENVTDLLGGVVADKYVRVDDNVDVRMDYEVFSPEEQVIWVNKDIYVAGGIDVSGLGHISGFEQGFDTEIPEPATLAILGAGGLMVAAKRRKKKA